MVVTLQTKVKVEAIRAIVSTIQIMCCVLVKSKPNTSSSLLRIVDKSHLVLTLFPVPGMVH